MTGNRRISTQVSRREQRSWPELDGDSRRSTHGRGHRWVDPAEYGRFVGGYLKHRYPDGSPQLQTLVDGFNPGQPYRAVTWANLAICASWSGGRLHICMMKWVAWPGWAGGRPVRCFDTPEDRDDFLADDLPYPDFGRTELWE